jgi:hypothetical protein
MRPALAIGWELWAKNRLGLSILGVGLLVAVVFCNVLPREVVAVPVQAFSGLLVFFAMLYLMSVFVYSEVGRGPNRPGFPAWKLTLPMRTTSLVAWPMLYGAAAIALLWVVLMCFIWRPSGLAREAVWWVLPMLIALLACFQAVAWLPLRSSLARLALAVVLLPTLAIGVMFGAANLSVRLYGDVRLRDMDHLMAYLCLALLPAAYLVALAGVARERRGGGWGWAWLGRRWDALDAWLPARPFASPARAQMWVEWRQKGLLLPLAMGAFLLVLIANTPAGTLEPRHLPPVVMTAAGLPIVLAFLLGFGMGKTAFWAGDLRLSSFLATRPLTNEALAVAKLRAAARTAVLTWLVVLSLTAVWAARSGGTVVLTQGWQWLVSEYAVSGAWAVVGLALAGLIFLTWMQLVAGMALALTGRPAVVNGFVVIYLAFAGAFIWLGVWTSSHPDFHDTLLSALWWMAGTAALGKLVALTWAVRGLRDGGLTAWRVSLCLAAVWLTAAGCVVALVWVLLGDKPVPSALIAVGVVLTFPLTRLIGLPLAVAWNRHQ